MHTLTTIINTLLRVLPVVQFKAVHLFKESTCNLHGTIKMTWSACVWSPVPVTQPLPTHLQTTIRIALFCILITMSFFFSTLTLKVFSDASFSNVVTRALPCPLTGTEQTECNALHDVALSGVHHIERFVAHYIGNPTDDPK